MIDETDISNIANTRRQEARDRLNSNLNQSVCGEGSPVGANAKINRDAVLAVLLPLVCALIFLVVGLMVIDQEAYSGRSKYGHPVELVGRQAVGMGILFISFAAVFAGFAVKSLQKSLAILFAGIGLAGLCTAFGVMLLR